MFSFEEKLAMLKQASTVADFKKLLAARKGAFGGRGFSVARDFDVMGFPGEMPLHQALTSLKKDRGVFDIGAYMASPKIPDGIEHLRVNRLNEPKDLRAIHSYSPEYRRRRELYSKNKQMNQDSFNNQIDEDYIQSLFNIQSQKPKTRKNTSIRPDWLDAVQQ